MSLFVTKAIDAVPIIAHATPMPIATASPEDWVLLSSWVCRENKWSWSYYHFLQLWTWIPNWEFQWFQPFIAACRRFCLGTWRYTEGVPHACTCTARRAWFKCGWDYVLDQVNQVHPIPPWRGFNTRLRECRRQQFPERGKEVPILARSNSFFPFWRSYHAGKTVYSRKKRLKFLS